MHYFLPHGPHRVWFVVEEEDWLAHKSCVRGRATQVSVARPDTVLTTTDDPEPQPRWPLNLDVTPMNDLTKLLKQKLGADEKERLVLWHNHELTTSWSIVMLENSQPNMTAPGRKQPPREAKSAAGLASSVRSVIIRMVPITLPEDEDEEDSEEDAAELQSERVVIIKASWQLLDRVLFEYAMLIEMQGQHGFPTVSSCLLSRHFMPLFEALEVKQWEAVAEDYYSQDTSLVREKRAHVMMMLHTKGSSLRGIVNDPQACASALLDIVIGQYFPFFRYVSNLFLLL